ncbi:MAG: response regulator [Verrucomicrobiae bacterium]|nr:response regulator [Verrucomicrobiae bacterium]
MCCPADCQMPDYNGLEAAELLRTKGWTGKIVMLSACPASIDPREAQKFGVGEALRKPFAASDLLDVLSVSACHHSDDQPQ